ncbi:MAG: 50S ribosomal protein L18e [Halobacteriota archaeon]
MSTQKQNPRLVDLVDELRSQAEASDAGVWSDVAARLDGPGRGHAEVNVAEIERYAGDEDAVVVPGKVLGGGVLSKSVTVAAFDYSSSAERKIAEADGEPLRLEEYVERNPDGTDVRVMG